MVSYLAYQTSVRRKGRAGPARPGPLVALPENLRPDSFDARRTLIAIPRRLLAEALQFHQVSQADPFGAKRPDCGRKRILGEEDRPLGEVLLKRKLAVEQARVEGNVERDETA